MNQDTLYCNHSALHKTENSNVYTFTSQNSQKHYQYTNSMQHPSPSETIELSASPELTSLLEKMKGDYCVWRRHPLIPIISQTNTVHTSNHTSLKQTFILSSRLHTGLQSSPFPSGFLTKTLYPFLCLTCILPGCTARIFH
jgi:hypothetical protein